MIEELRQLQAYVESHADEMELRQNSQQHLQVIWREPRKIILDVWPTTDSYRAGDAKDGEKAKQSCGQTSAWANECARMRAKILLKHPAAKPRASYGAEDLPGDVFSEAAFLVSLHALIMRMETVDPDQVCRLARRITLAACSH